MPSPFDKLGPVSKRPVEQFEIVGGAFTCQRNDCWSTVYEAKYFEDALLLTWKCDEGHISKIEDFVI